MVKYLTTAEVADMLRAPIETVRFWRHSGKGPIWFKAGRRVLYALEDVEAFVGKAKADESQSVTPQEAGILALSILEGGRSK